MLLSWNNLQYYQELMAGIRRSIEEGTFEEFRVRTKAQWAQGDIVAV